MQKGFIFILVLAIIIGIFAISNNAVVPINFVFAEVELSQAIVIFICVLLGAIIASIFGGIRQHSLKKNIKQVEAEKEIEKESLQAEIYRLEKVIEEKDEYMEAKEIKDTMRIADKIGKNELEQF
nr:LapA family protein [Tissierella sp.]